MVKKILLFCLISINLHASVLHKAQENAQIIFELLRNAAHASYIGEDVSQLDHALQAAYQATIMGGSQELIIAALFHDIGHQCAGESMDGWGTFQHEDIGADFLEKIGLSNTVCTLVRAHIQAKRYLCTDSIYYANLSEGSKQSMHYQGGPMNSQEAEAFKNDPLFEQKIALRLCDDNAKNPNIVVPPLEAYAEMVIKHLYEQLLHQQTNIQR